MDRRKSQMASSFNGLAQQQKPVSGGKPFDLIADSLRNGEATIQSLCKEYGANSCNTSGIISGIISNRESNWQNIEKELCSEIEQGASREDVLVRAGIDVGTKLECQEPSQNIQKQDSSRPIRTIRPSAI